MTRKHRMIALALVALLAWAIAACQEQNGGGGRLNITVDADGGSRVYTYDDAVSIGQFLEAIDLTLNPLDEVNPPLYTQLRDGLRVTITRVVEQRECERQTIRPGTEYVQSERLAPGEQQLGQTGLAGEEEICYLVTLKDGVEVSRNLASRFTITAPRDEVFYVGTEPNNTFVAIEGRLAYISAGQAMIIEGNSSRRRPLADLAGLDLRVFDLSADGRQLLFTRSTEDTSDLDFANELWAILDTSQSAAEPVQLFPSDVLYAQWLPGQENTFAYSTAVPTDDQIGWRAYNDLYVAELDPETGEAIPETVEPIIEQNALGLRAYWGRRFAWSPSGEHLAWANAEGVGLVNQETGEFEPLLSFTEYATLLPAVWVPTLSWSDDDTLITVVHGAPYGGESPEDSILFDTAVIGVENGIKLPEFRARTGIWSQPVYSPTFDGPGGQPTSMIAYFQAREPLNSLGSAYDLWIADGDGSNARRIFPAPDDSGQGFRSPDPEDGIAWSPNGRQLAFIYQKNLWIYDLDTGVASQITSDGQASRPRWSREP